ncbi:MAG: ABC transporter substrate-binding protein [Rubrobacter sp.]|nr:ABC transporter substrate-binding protein [Rubrobacter sp.]
MGIRGLLLAVALLGVALLAACSPPGTNTEGEGGGGGGGGGGKEAQQVVEETTGGSMEQAVCDVPPPNISLQDAVVGFSQSEEETNPFRIAETQSIRDEAKKQDVKKLIVTNAASQINKQNSDIRDMLAQGVDILIVAPYTADGLEPAFQAAAEQNVPVFLIDREVTAEPCENYITFMGSNFYRQGQQAADLLAEATNEEAQVAILEGTPGASVTTDRQNGFVDQLDAEYPNMEVVASQTANFVRTEGQTVMEQLLQSNPDLTAVYAHNDEMALGAVQAIKDAGKTPGKDIKIVSIDGTKGAVQALANGEMNGVVESNPRFGPLAFQTIEQFLTGQPIPQNIIISDRIYTPQNAEENLDVAY